MSQLALLVVPPPIAAAEILKVLRDSQPLQELVPLRLPVLLLLPPLA